MKLIRLIVLVLAFVALYFGFRFVTQSGLTGVEGSTQNDGYAVSGGLLILVAGMKFGWLLKELTKRK